MQVAQVVVAPAAVAVATQVAPAGLAARLDNLVLILVDLSKVLVVVPVAVAAHLVL
jgi:hypothetical protein